MTRASERKVRIVPAKPGLDGHYVGAEAVVRSLGLNGIFPTGSKFGDIVNFIREHVQ